MATETENYKLKKPAAADFYNIEDFNGNMDLIDTALKALDAGKAGLDETGKLVLEQLPELGQLSVARLYEGSYVGTGADASPTLTFPEPPRALFITPAAISGVGNSNFRQLLIFGGLGLLNLNGTSTNYDWIEVIPTVAGNSISWENSGKTLAGTTSGHQSADYYLNASGVEYHYIAIC